MAKVWVVLEFTDKDGQHLPGAEIDLPRGTDQEKADFERMVDRGIVTTTKPRPSTSGGDTPPKRGSE